MKPGDLIKIYLDPLTCLKLEGIGQVIDVWGFREGTDGERLRRVRVQLRAFGPPEWREVFEDCAKLGRVEGKVHTKERRNRNARPDYRRDCRAPIP